MKSTLIKVVTILGILAVVAGVSVYFALHGGGQIDINKQINATNQDGFTTPVLPDTRAAVPNGGLNPQGGNPTPQPPSPEPEQVSTSTAATTTDATASSTEAGDIPQDAVPEGTDTGAQSEPAQ